MAAAALALPVVLALLGLDYVITRNLIGAWVPAALALSAGGAVAGRRSGPAVIAALCVLGLVATVGVALDARYQRDDWRGAAGTVPVGARTALVVTPASGRVPLGYYLPASGALPAGGAPVSWVEVIALGARGVGAPVRAPPVPATGRPALPGFGGPVVLRRATYSVVRYRAAGPPVLVTAGMLAPLALTPVAPAVVLVDR